MQCKTVQLSLAVDDACKRLDWPKVALKESLGVVRAPCVFAESSLARGIAGRLLEDKLWRVPRFVYEVVPRRFVEEAARGCVWRRGVPEVQVGAQPVAGVFGSPAVCPVDEADGAADGTRLL